MFVGFGFLGSISVDLSLNFVEFVLACDGRRRKQLLVYRRGRDPMGLAEEDVDNGGNQIPDSGDEEGPLVGPGAPVPVVRHKRPLEFEKAFLDSLPSAQM